MSYSFTARAANKADALESIRRKMADIAAAQPCHRTDEATVVKAAEDLLALLPEAPTEDVVVNAYGSIGGTWNPGGQTIDRVTSVGYSLTAALAPRA